MLAHLDRLFPDRAPLVRWTDFEPGHESVESIARTLLDECSRRMEREVFLAFCHVNAERLRDHVDGVLDELALPLSTDEVLADTYADLYRKLRAAAPLAGSVHRLLATAADDVIREQADSLRARVVPLPGLPMAPVELSDSMVERAAQLTRSHRRLLPEKELQRWIAAAWIELEPAERRVLHLRERRGRSHAEIAEVLGLRPLEVVLLERRAVEHLHDTLVLYLERHARAEGQEPPAKRESSDSRSTRPNGKLIRMPARPHDREMPGGDADGDPR